MEAPPTKSPFVGTLAVLIAVLTWFLILLGGVVHGTGSSLACPDWPTCHGSFFPEMVGGVAIEHSHRLLASSVGLLTIILVIFSWRKGRTEIRNLSLVALGLVIFQGLLGGITVLLKLPPPVSIGHLATSMAFFALMLWISAKALGMQKCRIPGRRLVLLATCLTYLQLILGALVRHLGAGLACTDIPFCGGSLWPETLGYQAKVHMAHRWGAVLVTVVVLSAALKVLVNSRGQRVVGFLAGNLIFLVLAQVAFGLLSVATGLDLFPVSAHLALGALLWADLILLNYTLRGEAVEAANDGAIVMGPQGELAR